MFSLFKKKPIKQPEFNESYCKSFLGEEDFQNYQKLRQNIKQDLIPKKEMTLFNPGAEDDIVNPLLTLDAITDLNEEKEIKMYFIDIKDLTIFIENNIKKLIPNTTIKKSKINQQTQLTFKIKKSKITIIPIVDDAFNAIQKINEWDIYFERAFEIIRHDKIEFNEQVFSKTKNIIISDTNFIQDSNKTQNVWQKISDLPTQIGFYKNFTIYKKEQ